MAIILNEEENDTFRQLVLLLSNCIWLLLSNFYCDRDSPIKFTLTRMFFWTILGLSRASVYYPESNTDLNRNSDDIITPRRIKIV